MSYTLTEPVFSIWSSPNVTIGVGELILLARLILEPVTTISSATSADSSSSAEIEKTEPKLSNATKAKPNPDFKLNNMVFFIKYPQNIKITRAQ